MIEDDVRPIRRGRQTVPAGPEDDALAGRREVLQRLHRVAVNMETADVLDHRADCSGNATLAAVLHERAAQRRRVAERLRAGIPETGRDATG